MHNENTSVMDDEILCWLMGFIEGVFISMTELSTWGWEC